MRMTRSRYAACLRSSFAAATARFLNGCCRSGCRSIAALRFLRRNELGNPTRQFVDRIDFEPRVTTALRWKDIHLIPSFSIRETHYGSSLDTQGHITGNGIMRSSREFSADLIFPSFARVYGGKRKHVIEPRAYYRFVNGIDNFHSFILFDETELLSNTNELEVSLTNRLFTKEKDGRVEDSLVGPSPTDDSSIPHSAARWWTASAMCC